MVYKILLYSALSNLLITILNFYCLVRIQWLLFQSSKENHSVNYPLAAGIQLLHIYPKNFLLKVRSYLFWTSRFWFFCYSSFVNLTNFYHERFPASDWLSKVQAL